MDTDRGLREVARDFDDLIEKKDQEALLDFFSKECEVQMFGVVLRGIEGARKWLNWLFSNASSVRFEPIMILTDGDALFEEFREKFFVAFSYWKFTGGAHNMSKRNVLVVQVDDGLFVWSSKEVLWVFHEVLVKWVLESNQCNQ